MAQTIRLDDHRCVVRREAFYQCGDMIPAMEGRSYTPIDYGLDRPMFAPTDIPTRIPVEKRPADLNYFAKAEVSRRLDMTSAHFPSAPARIAMVAGKEALMAQARECEAKMMALQDELAELCVQQGYALACIAAAESVTHIIQGIPLHATSTSVKSLDPAMDRSGFIRKNCYYGPNNQNAWILTLHSPSLFDLLKSGGYSNEERHTGSDYPADVAMEIIWAFVLHDVVPNQ